MIQNTLSGSGSRTFGQPAELAEVVSETCRTDAGAPYAGDRVGYADVDNIFAHPAGATTR